MFYFKYLKEFPIQVKLINNNKGKRIMQCYNLFLGILKKITIKKLTNNSIN